ncbi:MAG TPA: 3-keto-5-aminohexanoate cleavage protein [Mycobacteriales bacterium]|nr:3-keto-5-aminohexanoate cleavage protein [Mycobacteriales bacterium]
MPTGTLITVAPTGAETAKDAAAGLPVTLEELVHAAVECQAAGASVIHVHVRDDATSSTLDLVRLRETVSALRAETDLVVQLSTGGAVTDSEADRLRVLEAGPDSASLTCGTVNFGDDVFLNRRPFVVALYQAMQERGIVPEFECFDTGHLATVSWLLERHGPPYGGRVHVDLVLGVPGGLPGTASALAAAVTALPEGATFSATGVGRAHLPVMLAALAHGGHLRVGMEDTLTFAAGEPVRDNAQLVARAAALATLAQRPPLDPVAARDLLGVPAPR